MRVFQYIIVLASGVGLGLLAVLLFFGRSSASAPPVNQPIPPPPPLELPEAPVAVTVERRFDLHIADDASPTDWAKALAAAVDGEIGAPRMVITDRHLVLVVRSGEWQTAVGQAIEAAGGTPAKPVLALIPDPGAEPANRPENVERLLQPHSVEVWILQRRSDVLANEEDSLP